MNLEVKKGPNHTFLVIDGEEELESFMTRDDADKGKKLLERIAELEKPVKITGRKKFMTENFDGGPDNVA